MEQTRTKLAITALTWNAANQPKPGTPFTSTFLLTNVGEAELPAGYQETSLTVWVNQKPLPFIRFDGGLDVGKSQTPDSEPWRPLPVIM